MYDGEQEILHSSSFCLEIHTSTWKPSIDLFLTLEELSFFLIGFSLLVAITILSNSAAVNLVSEREKV